MSSPSNSCGTGKEEGFTLLEVLVVLAIVGLLLTVVPAGLSRAADAARSRAALEALEQGLKTARLKAVASGTVTAVRVDPAAGRWWVEPMGASGALPPGRISLEVADEGRSDTAGAVFFFPDGGASGFRLDVTGDLSVRRLTVDWLTGRVEVAG